VTREVRHIFDQHDLRADDRNVLWDRGQHTVVPVAPVVESVPQPAEAFAWWPGRKKVHPHRAAGEGSYGAARVTTEQIARAGHGIGRVVIVDRNRFSPRVVRLGNVKADRSETDPDAA
jgi:hypothetical protein